MNPWNPFELIFDPMMFIDGYKLDHRRQYPKKTQRVYSNWTPRSSRTAAKKVVFFGMQYFLRRYMMEYMEPWFHASEQYVTERYKRRVDKYLGPNDIGIEHIRNLHRLGHIPLEFSSLPEGTEVPLRVPPWVVENTHDEFYWMPNYIETVGSSVIWLPSTSATTALQYRRLLNAAAKRTHGTLAAVPYQGHDFSMRGMEGPIAAALSSAGHLLSFLGTDTVPALDLIEHYYGGDTADYIHGVSVAATEHSVMSAGGEEGEMNTIRHLLDLYPRGIFAMVCDTYDLWRLITEYLPLFKAEILSRDGKVVIRPDSGDPVKIICGDDGAPVDSPAHKGVIQLLWDIFGGTINHGFKELDSHIGAIYGDSITLERAQAIVERLEAKGFASTNIVLGIGSFTYQYVTRDTYGHAMKATWVQIDNVARPIFKKPKTDDGTKNSAMGRLAVHRDEQGELILINNATPEQEAASLHKPIWINSKFIRTESYAPIRERVLALAEAA